MFETAMPNGTCFIVQRIAKLKFFFSVIILHRIGVPFRYAIISFWDNSIAFQIISKGWDFQCRTCSWYKLDHVGHQGSIPVCYL